MSTELDKVYNEAFAEAYAEGYAYGQADRLADSQGCTTPAGLRDLPERNAS